MLQSAYMADAHDMEGYLNLFTEDGSIFRMGKEVAGQDAISALLKGRSRERITRHVMSPPSITLLENGDVEGLSYYTLFEAQSTECENPPYPLRLPTSVGEYRHKYRYTENGWRIREHHIKSIFKQPGA